MHRAIRLLLRVVLLLGGLLLALFFGLLYFVADCGTGCEARGEHAPIYVAVGLGLGAALAGVLLHRGARTAAAFGLALGGAVCLAWSLVALRTEGAWVWASAAAGFAAAVGGSWMLQRRAGA